MLEKNKYKWLDKYCLKFKGASKKYQPDWEAFQFKVRDKLFAYTADHPCGRPVITLKGVPADNDILRQKYEDIIAGYYMNKDWWNTVYLDGKVPDDVLKELISNSYRLIFDGFSKKVREEIENG